MPPAFFMAGGQDMDEPKTYFARKSPTGEPQLCTLPSDASWAVVEVQQAFLAHLAMTCNVSASARHVGLGSKGAYCLKERDGTFRDAWTAAIDAGRERMWELLHEEAIARMNPPEPADGGTPPPCDPSLALRMLQIHAPGREHRGGMKIARRVPMTANELRLLIADKLSAKNRELGGDG